SSRLRYFLHFLCQVNLSALFPYTSLFRSRDDAKQKLIVLHLLGTHTAYHQRYPEEFNHFSGSGKKEKIIAEYDNAVRYNDFVVEDRKSTRLNSSHVKISYAVFCLKKKNQY